MGGLASAPVAMVALLLAMPATIAAQTADVLAQTVEEKAPTAEEKEADEEPSCRDETPAEQPALETMREGLQRGVCSTARFVDRLFGGEHEYSEYEDQNNGRAGLTAGWNKLDDFSGALRFRASVALPALNERFSATVGRASRDEFVSDELNGTGALGASFSTDEPADWFAGLGYRMKRGRDSRFDLGAGVGIGAPLNPYVNARYRRYIYLRNQLLLTLRSTPFWEYKEGFGFTQGFDLDHVLGRDYLLRWGNILRISEETEGVRWRSRLALYQAIDYRRAMRYEVRIRGETDGTQPDLYGFRATHRRSMWRDWVFVEFGAGVFWADGPEPSDRCDGCLDVLLGFEILFGEAYDRALRRQEREDRAAKQP
jgi:hypothetical protein